MTELTCHTQGVLSGLESLHPSVSPHSVSCSAAVVYIPPVYQNNNEKNKDR